MELWPPKGYDALLGRVQFLWEGIEYTVLDYRPELHTNHLRIFDLYVLPYT